MGIARAIGAGEPGVGPGAAAAAKVDDHGSFAGDVLDARLNHLLDDLGDFFLDLLFHHDRLFDELFLLYNDRLLDDLFHFHDLGLAGCKRCAGGSDPGQLQEPATIDPSFFHGSSPLEFVKPRCMPIDKQRYAPLDLWNLCELTPFHACVYKQKQAKHITTSRIVLCLQPTDCVPYRYARLARFINDVCGQHGPYRGLRCPKKAEPMSRYRVRNLAGICREGSHTTVGMLYPIKFLVKSVHLPLAPLSIFRADSRHGQR